MVSLNLAADDCSLRCWTAPPVPHTFSEITLGTPVTTVRTRPLVLLVEDFRDAVDLYEITLTDDGFGVLTAADAVTGIDMARTYQPDVIVMDGGLPGMTGWEAISVLKNDPLTRSIAVLIFTVHVEQASKDEAMRVGADAFVDKPCEPDHLAKMIRQVLRNQGSARRQMD
jgi:two-component system, cell cycle response regulator DivK